MEMIDRVSLFKEITQMRTLVHSAKSTASRRLIRKLQKLRKKNGTEKAKLKNERKAGRLAEELKEIKKIKPDQISKFALVTSKEDCEKIISDVDSTLAQRGTARVTCEKSMQVKMDTLRGLYTNWDQVPKILARKKEKIIQRPKVRARAPSDTESRTEDKTRKQNTDIVVGETDSDNQSSDDEADTTEDNSSGELTLHLSESEEGEVEGDDSATPPMEPIVEETTVKKSSKKVTKKHFKEESKGKTAKQPLNKEKNFAIESNGSAVAVVKKITDLQELEDAKWSSKDASLDPILQDTGRKDSFFLTADGGEIESEDDEQDDSSEDSDGSDYKNDFHFKQSVGSAEANNGKFGRNFTTSLNTPAGSRRFDNFKNKYLATPAPLSSSRRLEEDPSNKEKLHPSWAAKRKEKIALLEPPRNKKIKFDE